MASDDPSGARPAGPVVLRIKLRYDDVATLIQRFATNVGKSGLFLPTKSIQPIGTEVKFELRLSNDTPVLVGLGRVKHVKPPDPERPKAPFGMGIELMRVSREGRELILKMIERRRALGLADVAIPFPEEGDVARRSDDSQPRADSVPRDGVSRFASEPVIEHVLASPPTSTGPIAVAKSDASGPVGSAIPIVATDSSSGRRSVRMLAPERARSRRPRLAEVIARANEASGPHAGAGADLDDHVDVERALTRARALATGDLDSELSLLRESAAAPIEITIDAASAELARQLGGKAISRRERSATWVAPPPVEARREIETPTIEPAIVTPDNLAARAVTQLAMGVEPTENTIDQSAIEGSSGPAVAEAPPVREEREPRAKRPSAFDKRRRAARTSRPLVQEEREPEPVAPEDAADDVQPSFEERAADVTVVAPEPATTYVDVERGEDAIPTASGTALTDVDGGGGWSERRQFLRAESISEFSADFSEDERTRVPSGDDFTAVSVDERTSFSNIDEEALRTEPGIRPSSAIVPSGALIDDHVDPTAFARILEGSQPAMALDESDIESVQDIESGESTHVGANHGDAFGRGSASASDQLADQLDRHLADAEAEADDDFRDLREDQSIPPLAAYTISPRTDAQLDEPTAGHDADDIDDLDVLARADAARAERVRAQVEEDFASRLDLGDDDAASEQSYTTPAPFSRAPRAVRDTSNDVSHAKPVAVRADLEQALAALDVDLDELSVDNHRRQRSPSSQHRPLPGLPHEREDDTGATMVARPRTGANATIKPAPEERPRTGAQPIVRGGDRGGTAPTRPPPIPAAARRTATTPPPLPVRPPPKRATTNDDGIIIDFDDDD